MVFEDLDSEQLIQTIVFGCPEAGNHVKTTVFANKAIVTGLKKIEETGRLPASTNKKELFTSEPLDRALGTYWTNDILRGL